MASASARGTRLTPLWRVLRACAWLLVFCFSCALGVLLHLNAPPLRAAASQALSRALAGQFRGQVTFEGIHHVGLASSALGRIALRDRGGTEVLSLDGVRLRYRPLELLARLLGLSRGPVRLEHLRVDESHIALVQNPESGEWTLLEALARPERAPAREGRRAGPPRTYQIEQLEIGDLHVRMEHPTLGAIEARVRRLNANLELAGDESRVSVERFGVQLLAAGELWLDGTGSLQLLPKRFVAGTFHGFAGGAEVDASGRFDDGELSIAVAIPRALPEQLAKRLPGWPLRYPLSARVTASGRLDALAVAAEVSAGSSRLSAQGSARAVGEAEARLALELSGLDARLFSAEAPETSLAARGTLALMGAPTGFRAAVELDTEPTQIAGVAVPRTHVDAALEAGALEGRWRARDRRGALEARFTASAVSGLELDAKLTGVELGAWPELGGAAQGRGEANLQLQLSAGTLDARLDAELSQFRSGTLELEHAALTTTVRSPVSELDRANFDVTLSSRAGRFGPFAFERGRLRLAGPLSAGRFEADFASAERRSGSARGTLSLAPALAVKGLTVHWAEPGLALDAEIARLEPALQRVEVTRVAISGDVGSLQGSAEVAPGRIELELDAERLDLSWLGRSFALSTADTRGLVSGRVELSLGSARARGSAALTIENCEVQRAALGTVQLQATLDQSRLEVGVSNAGSPLGNVAAKGALVLSGDVLELRTWQRATGEASVSVSSLPLWPAGVLLAQSTEVEDLDGHLDAALQLERAEPDGFPHIFIQANTRELSFRVARKAQGGSDAAFAGLALHASASVDGKSGQGLATLLVVDEQGALVTTSGALELELERLRRDPKDFLRQLLHRPLDGLLRLHERPLSKLPPPFTVGDLDGTVEASLAIHGSLAEPNLTLAATGRDLRGQFADAARAVGVSSLFVYTPNTGQLGGHASMTQAGRTLVNARLLGTLASPLAGEATGVVTDLYAAAMLSGVPLELWPAAARERLEARLYGSVDLELRAGALAQRAQIEIVDLSAQGQALGNGRLSLDSRLGRTQAQLTLGDSQRFLQAQLSSAALAELEGTSPLEGTLRAKDFSASSLSPLLGGILTRITGDMDAELKFTLRRTPEQDWYLGIDGRAELENGSAHVDVLGVEVRDIDALVTARSTPRYSVFMIDPLSAKVRSQNDNLSGDAELWMQGLRITDGEANLTLNGVPLSLKGASRGMAQGRVRARLERQPGRMHVEVKPSGLKVVLPRSSARSLIGLEANPDIEFVNREPERERDASGEPLRWRIALDLSDTVLLERADLDVRLSGAAVLDFQPELSPSGTIEAVPGGRVLLFDRTFTVDRGLVTLLPERPNDPAVDITASWRAPDGTTIYVDITGSMDDAVVSTRDDRGLQDVERFALLTGAGGDTGGLGQTFALGLNELLRESVGNVAVSIGTSDDDRASYSASVRLSDKLSFQGAFKPAAETRAEAATSDLTGSLDYRFARNWSLRTELGTSGGAFDLLWSHRY